MPGFQLYQDEQGEFRWRLRANNNETILQASEGYSSKDAAMRSVEIIKEAGLSSGPEIYQDNAGKFRFRIAAPNGNVIAVGQAYKNEADCSKTVSLVNQLAPQANVDDQTA